MKMIVTLFSEALNKSLRLGYSRIRSRCNAELAAVSWRWVRKATQQTARGRMAECRRGLGLRFLASVMMLLVWCAGSAGIANATDLVTDFPAKPIKIVVPYPPGGSTDLLARLLGQKLRDSLGQPVMVENRAGASGSIGASFAARSLADGYTIFLGTSTALAVNPHLYKALTYDPQKDFAPIILATTLPSLVVVNAAVPVKSMAELTEYLKTNPEKATYASSGNGTPAHLGAEMYKKMTGSQVRHIPYKGGALALGDLAAGQTTMMFGILPETLPLVKAGRLRALAITTMERSSLVPDLPTVSESGVPGYELVGWYAFLAPAGTPKPIISKLNQAFGDALKDKEVREKLSGAGFEIAGGSPERLANLIRSESKKWEQVVIDAKVKID
jgi:tripartite-type tricarboxylate transporter receptor subunit TctC